MGTEILVIFLPIPMICWAWNLWQMCRKETRTKGAVLLLLGLIFMLYMVYPITTKQYFMQGLMIGGFFYIPFYLISWVAVTGGLIAYKRKQSAETNA